MKLPAFLVGWMILASASFASLTEFAKVERPVVSLEEAVQVTKAILKVQGDSEKYYIVQAELFGGDRDEGARWILFLQDAGGDRATVLIMTRSPDCSIRYSGGSKSSEVSFRRDGVAVLRVKRE